MLSRFRTLIQQANPDVVEAWKWRGVPVWERDGIICTGETYKSVVKMTFAKGAALKDPSELFNSSLEGNVSRAIDIQEGDKVNERALKNLVRAAVDYNQSRMKKRAHWGTRARKLPKPKRPDAIAGQAALPGPATAGKRASIGCQKPMPRKTQENLVGVADRSGAISLRRRGAAAADTKRPGPGANSA